MKSIKSAFTSFAFKVPDELMDQVKLSAGRDFRDVNDVVVELLLEYVRRGRVMEPIQKYVSSTVLGNGHAHRGAD